MALVNNKKHNNNNNCYVALQVKRGEKEKFSLERKFILEYFWLRFSPFFRFGIPENRFPSELMSL